MSGIRNAALVTVGLLGAFVGLAYPDLFLLGLAIVLAVWLVIVHAQRDEIAAKWAEAVFAQRSAEHRAETLAGDYDAVVKRLGEVLDEHALCPAPVRPEPVMVELVAVDKASRTLRALASGPIPQQRDGSES